MAKKIKLKKEEQDHLAGVVDWTLQYYIDYIFPWIYEIIKMKTWYTADIEAELDKLDPDWDNTYYTYPIIEPNIDAFVANSFDIDTMWRPVPIKASKDWLKAVNDASDYLSWVEPMVDWKDVEDTMRAEATTIWTSYCKYWYKKKDGNKIPYADHVSFFELFAVPWARDFYDSRYKVYRRIMSDREVESVYSALLTDSMMTKIIKDRWNCFVDWDFNKIRDLKFYEEALRTEISNITANEMSPVEVFTKALSKQFMVIDWENGNNEVIEVWDGWTCHVIINQEYRFSFEEYNDAPFWYMVFEKQSWTYLGRWLWHKLMPSQKDANFLYNSLRKAIRQDVFPDTMTIPWALVDPITAQTPTELSYKWWKNYTLNPSASFGWEAFKKITYADSNTIWLLRARLTEVIQEAQLIAGTSSYTLWWQGKIERVAWWVAQRNEVFLSRQKPMVSSIKKLKSHAFYIWLEIANKIDKDLLIKVSESWENTTIWDINVKDILTKTYAWVDTETNKSIRRYENIQLWTQILWVLSWMANVPDAQKYMLDILKKVTYDYAYDWIDQETWEKQEQWISEDMLKQLQWQEQLVQWNNRIEQNMDLWSLIWSIPLDAWGQENIPDVWF